MKKQFLLTLFLLNSLFYYSQFVNGVGIFISGMGSRHSYLNGGSTSRIESHSGNYIFRPSGGIVADFGRDDYAKWRTEFQYNTMGACEAINVDGELKTFGNKLDYISWNNFFKLQIETYAGYPYILIGGRAQYLINNQPSIYQEVYNNFNSIHFSWNIAAGFELMAYGPFRFFTEYHFINDIPSLYNNDNLMIRSLTHELRIGLMFRFMEKTERCNTPIYNDNY
jgi:hypothetical protein